MLPKLPLSRLRLNARQKRILKFACVGTLLVCIASAIVAIDPLTIIVKDQLSIREGSFLFGLFKAPPLEVFISVYVFNVTNVAEFVSGQHKKLRVEEVGPYVYQEYLDHINYTYHDNGTLSYYPRRRVEFRPERSIGDPKLQFVTVPNIPLLGATTAASEMSVFAALAVSTLSTSMDAQPILNLTVHDYLWGYNDTLVALASKVVPNLITFERFGLLDRMFDEGVNEVTINLPKAVHNHAEQRIKLREEMERNGTLDRMPIDIMPVRDFSIEYWNGNAGLNYWNYNESDHNSKRNTACNTLRGSYDGTVFPQNISKNEEFRIYRKAFCRTLPVRFAHSSQLHGLEAYHFELVEDAFDTAPDDPESSCFCSESKCLPRGLGKITPCYYNIPTAVSYPHFYRSDPRLLAGVDGLQPDADRHAFEVVLQPQLGVPMRVNSRLQINLLMDSVRFNTAVRPFANVVLPIVWMEIAVEQLTTELIVLLNVLFNVLPFAQAAVVIGLCVLGVGLFAVAAVSFFCVTRWSFPLDVADADGTVPASNGPDAGVYSKCATIAVAEAEFGAGKPDISRWSMSSMYYWFPPHGHHVEHCAEDEQVLAMLADVQATIDRCTAA